jgi:hypothetical protein
VIRAAISIAAAPSTTVTTSAVAAATITAGTINCAAIARITIVRGMRTPFRLVFVDETEEADDKHGNNGGNHKAHALSSRWLTHDSIMAVAVAP